MSIEADTAQVRYHNIRLALLYALLDGAHVIEPVHLRAAVAVWQYCEVSATYIFSGHKTDSVRVARRSYTRCKQVR